MHETPVTPMTGKDYSDDQILAIYKRKGDRELFAHLVRRYERELYGYLRRYVGNAEMAEDVFQATFLQIHLKCEQFDEGRRFRPWLYTIATNQAIDAQRRNKRHRMASLDRTAKSDDSVDIGALVNLLKAVKVIRLIMLLNCSEDSGFNRPLANCLNKCVVLLI